MAAKFTKPKGTQDIIENVGCWQYVEDKIRELCQIYGISEIRTPMYEQADLFIRGVGETTDIVTKEMFCFTDAGGRNFALRPEGTVNAARAYIENGFANGVQPVKWYYVSPTFRAERPQLGRYRQFTQFGVEYFGSDSPYADAELISVFYELLNMLNIKDVELRINSLGGNACRERYNGLLKDYIGANIDKLCPVCKERFVKNPLRVLDCKSDGCKAVIAGAPSSVESLDTECKRHFDGVCAGLDDLGIPYVIDPLTVRGLDYYTRTVFEFVSGSLGAQSTVCGGGRYDNLIYECGGQKTGAVGFGVGLDRIMLILGEKKPETSKSIYIGSIGEKGAKKARELTQSLRRGGITAVCDILERSVKAQMRYADKIGAAFVVILGDNEVESGKVRVKDMSGGGEIESRIEDIATVITNL